MMHLLFPYILSALGLIGCLFLFFSLKVELQRNARKNRKRVEEVAMQISLASQRPEPEPAPILSSSHVRPGFNLSKRFQALRMLRRGQDLAHVSAALGVSQSEVELLIRVHRISSASVAAALSQASASLSQSAAASAALSQSTAASAALNQSVAASAASGSVPPGTGPGSAAAVQTVAATPPSAY